MRASLTPHPQVRNELNLPESFQLDSPSITIGRSKDCTICLDSRYVSRKHATLTYTKNHWQIKNLSDNNPVRINGLIISSAILCSGDTVSLGPAMLTFTDHDQNDENLHLVERNLEDPFETIFEDTNPKSKRIHQMLDSIVNVLEQPVTSTSEKYILDFLRKSINNLIANDLIILAKAQNGTLLLDATDDYCSTVINRCEESRKSVLWNMADSFTESQSAGGFGIHSAICAPLGALTEEPRGFIYLHRNSSPDFSTDDLNFVTAFARIAGAVAENIWLRQRLRQELHELKSRPEGQIDIKISGKKMMHVVERAQQLARDNTIGVLLQGETGTGKDVIAKIIHQASPRSKGPFIAINCAAIPENLLESELFGYAKNSGISNADPAGRVGQILKADQGTLFLDEIGELPATLQAKLLRVLDTSLVEPIGSKDPIVVDFRLLSATNRDIEAMIQTHEFREDLLHRLGGSRLTIPPLRERIDEITPLAEHFAHFYFTQLRKQAPATLISKDVLQMLKSQYWKGNIRQLRNVIQNAVILAGSETLELSDFEQYTDNAAIRPPILTLAENEQQHIQYVLTIAGGNKSLAAEMLGIHRNTLASKLRGDPKNDR